MQNIDDVLLRKHCKEGVSVVIHFWVPTKKMRKYKKKYSKEIQKNKRSKKMMLEC